MSATRFDHFMYPDNKPSDVLLHVRTAYRLLHDYQRMVLDVIRYLRLNLNIDDYVASQSFDGGFRDGWNDTLDKSSWVWLPMYLCEIRFWKEVEKNGLLSLSFFVISDTGFIDGNYREGDEEKVLGFTRPQNSSTVFAFFLSAQWEPNLYSFIVDPEDKGQTIEFIKTGSVETPRFVGKCYEMACLKSESAVDNVIKDIVKLAQENEWSWPRERCPSAPIQD